MTRLLVSVRTLDEAIIAAEAGVDLIDVKEPRRGPLGMADVEIRLAIGQRLGHSHLLSAACGELHDWIKGDWSTDNPSAWSNYRYAKIGLTDCRDYTNWYSDWLAWRQSLPSGVESVLVCYADNERCNAPSYSELRRFAVQHGLRMMLFDTYDKSGPGLCQLWQPTDFLRIGEELQAAGISYVFAGKIELDDIGKLHQSHAAYLGVRGAVCDSTGLADDRRCGNLSAFKIKSWQRALRTPTLDTR
jgi:(5-formylfuran-3-yl)methyl phosphate synthase